MVQTPICNDSRLPLAFCSTYIGTCNGYGGYGGYGYGDYYGYNNYYNYYMMAAYANASSSSSTTSSAMELDRDRFYNARLNGPGATSDKPSLKITFSAPKKAE